MTIDKSKCEFQEKNTSDRLLTQQPSKKSFKYSRYVKGVIIAGVVVIAFFSYWFYYSYYLQQTRIAPQAYGFLLEEEAPPSGCAVTNETTGQINLVFYLNITNRLNATVHLVNASLRVNFRLSNGTDEQVSTVPYTVSYQASGIIRLTVYLPVAGKGFEHGSITFAYLLVTLFIEGVNYSVTFGLNLPVSAPPYRKCSVL